MKASVAVDKGREDAGNTLSERSAISTSCVREKNKKLALGGVASEPVQTAVPSEVDSTRVDAVS
eukprot:6203280-Pyramimonas_sp.AAC.1